MQVHLVRSSSHLYVNVKIIHALGLDMSWLCHMLVYNWGYVHTCLDLHINMF